MNKKFITIGFGIVAVLLIWSGVSIYPDWLWFENLDFAPVFWTMVIGRFGLGGVIWLLLIIILSINLYAARRSSPGGGSGGTFGGAAPISGKSFNILFLVFILDDFHSRGFFSRQHIIGITFGVKVFFNGYYLHVIPFMQ